MYSLAASSFITNYIHGFGWLIFIVVVHILLSTLTHIVKKDFKVSEWPTFLSMWLLFVVAIIVVNGIVAVSATLVSAAILLPIVSILQATVYTMYFSYYLDNIFKHLNMLGLPIDGGIIQVIKTMTGKITGQFTGGNL